MKVKLIRSTEKPVEAMALAASVSYNSSFEDYEAIVKDCIEKGHTSILEFADFHFEISEVSRVETHQQVRKRHASYNQRSQRYVNEDGFDFTIPDTVIKNGFKTTFQENVGRLKRVYNKLLEAGVPKEDARYLLPNATHSKIHVKMNFLSLMELANMRLCRRAQWEIREVVGKMKELVVKVSPFLGKYLTPKCYHLEYCPEGNQCCGLMPTKEELLTKAENSEKAEEDLVELANMLVKKNDDMDKVCRMLSKYNIKPDLSVDGLFKKQ